MMEGNRKLFCNLSTRQQNRRLKIFLDTPNESDISSINNTSHTVPLPDCVSSNEYIESSTNEFIESSIVGDVNISESESLNCEENPNSETVTPIPIQCTSSCQSAFMMHLAEWAIHEKNVSNDSVTRLLTSVRKSFPEFPATAKTLKKKIYSDCKEDQLYELGDGEYIHFDWVNSLKILIESQYKQNTKKHISLAVNIDGLPLYKTTNKYTAYPILMSALEYPSKIITVGLYCSNKTSQKGMPDPKNLLQRFIQDVDQLSGQLECSAGTFTVSLGPFICDAPVRSDLKSVIGHGGYNACERCIQHGIYAGRHVCLTENDCPTRTDDNFKMHTDPDHHRENVSLLESINYPMVSGFVLDIMHMCFLGVTKRLVGRLNSSKKGMKKVHIGGHAKSIFDTKCQELSKFIPSDFNRRCDGGLTNLARWKATEFRLFLLYTGLIILSHRNIVPEAIYQNFKLFSIAIRMLTLDNQEQNMPFVKKLLIQFIKEAIEIYGTSFVSYNVHSVEHLVDDYLKYGNLDNISAFKYESYLGAHVKAPVLAGYKPIKQIARHIKLQNNMKVDVPINSNMVGVSETVPVTEAFQGVAFKKLIFGQKFSIRRGNLGCRDNTIELIDNKIAVVRDIIASKNEMKLIIQKFEVQKAFFEVPIDSRQIGIYKLKLPLEEVCKISIKEMLHKMILLPIKNSYVAIRLPHTSVPDFLNE